ncbi:hypothetical protein E0493_19675 [Roseomonas sp. M0104]|uniref:Uncharacterized protein n=1 Tax=Teichococcus coralli TaxID=2545983 RepID=A0A845BK86_9PROT|nr:hypothetical protein [Pseudoroseomonas coralli]MXP65572.1 hypothetical protein [Pseudoroseomonas coralli]
MLTRVRPGQDGGWQVLVGQGATGFGRDGFPDRAAAEDWAGRAGLAARQCTIRISSKRFLGTAGEALRRWAIDQGTLPRAEGGTQVAPLQRLMPLLEEPDCALPLAVLSPEDLAALRGRRRAALPSPGAALAEQAALAAALEQFRDFHLPALDDPFGEIAPDGFCVLDEASCAQAIGWAGQMSEAWGRLVALVLTTGAPVAALLAACCGHADIRAGRLHLPGGPVLTPPADLLPDPAASPEAPLLPGLREAGVVAAGMRELGSRLRRPGLQADALQLTALVAALNQGQHLDEILVLAGALEARR